MKRTPFKPFTLPAPTTYGERKAYLTSLAFNTQEGGLYVVFHWNELHGHPWQAQGPIGKPFSLIIAEILKIEFPDHIEDEE
jgi:hypothetical protein